MIDIDDSNGVYDWATGKVKAVEASDLVNPENANAGVKELALRTANLHGRTDLLELWKTSLTGDDADSIVNTYNEMKEFLSSTPEGVNFITELNRKADKSSVVNDLTTGGVDKMLSAEQGKLINDKLINGGQINSGDLNNITETGIYNIGNENAITNFPQDAYGYGVLQVLSTVWFVTQTYITHTSELWYRGNVKSPNAWTVANNLAWYPWRKASTARVYEGSLPANGVYTTGDLFFQNNNVVSIRTHFGAWRQLFGN